jgi:formylglycine-generating enzyme required for sulfatase activity
MEALAQDLRAWLEGRVVRAYETGGWAELKKWVRRNRRFSVAAAAAVLALVLGLGAAAYVQSVGRARVERLADRQLLDELAEEAELLWPADEAHAAALGDWVARARELVRRRARHEATLRELDAEAAAAAERADDAGGDAGAAGGWSFADPERRWLHVKLRELVAGLADFAAADPPGLLARVEQRLDAARTLRARSIEAHAGAWAAARSASRPIELAPQLGLVPLGPDPRSGLEEFAHLPSGAAPVRGAAGDLVLAPECGIVLVLLPGGRFDMGARAPATPGEIGSPNVDPLAFEGEGPVRGVELAPFFLAKHELTRAQWRRVAGGDPSFDAEAGGSDQRPVDSVSWEQAALMLGRLGLELPSEAQWEYAARAGTSTPWPWGGDSAPLAASGEVYLPASRPIGELAPNAWGIAGLLGNVSEWCSDRYRDDRAHRGAWFSLGSSGENDELVAQIARASMRMHAGPGELRPIIGMRAARRVDP